ncbi:uncharacterized protein CTRU02_210806 [Colletotrichum truncatum]|uniref:Uncharacterized protein n=1 Tax=Colletotrichum truncatum TaxID=5467 RepID=A0ACC3YS86_COLTU|nr:uncharacterized protein CTRU02_03709 [Colletotrichum truncatum]KAF6796731.1 hypothetical protein CTRU02_03709 [Colletotrichum truncatum]
MAAYVDAFMEIRAPQIDPSWQISATNKFTEKRRQQQASQKAQERTRSFKNLVNTFVKHTKRGELARFDVNRQFRWEDVRSMASDAIEQDAEKVKWRRNPFRAAGRSLQQGASNLEMLMAFLPNGEFTGILCGALTLVFSAARRLDEVRNKILGCLESLPEIVGQTEAYVDIYDDDPKVWNAAEDLYIGILDAVEGMLIWIDKSAVERAFKSLLLPATFGRDLEENSIKRNIEDKVVQFREIVQVNLHKKIGQQYKAIQTLQTHLNSLLSYAKWSYENPQSVMIFKPSFITLNQLRGIIDVDNHALRKEMDTAILDAQNVCPPNLISHALCILRNHKFVTWLQSDTSQILFVNGRMQLNAEQEATSPLTILSCILYQSVGMQSDRSLPLLYLCGQKSSQLDHTHAGSSEVLRYLNAQLMNSVPQEDVDLTEIDLTFVDALKERRTGALCALFRILLSAAIGKAVFVIIDGVSWMEEGPFAEGFEHLVFFLRDLVIELNRRRPHLILKVLLNNPSTSLYGSRWLPDSSILEMDEVEDGVDFPEDAESFLL